MHELRKLDRADFRPEFRTPVQEDVFYLIGGDLVNQLRNDLGTLDRARWVMETMVELGTPKAENKECPSESA